MQPLPKLESQMWEQVAKRASGLRPWDVYDNSQPEHPTRDALEQHLRSALLDV